MGRGERWRTGEARLEEAASRRLLGPIGHVSPAEFEQQYYLVQEAPVIAAGVN